MRMLCLFEKQTFLMTPIDPNELGRADLRLCCSKEIEETLHRRGHMVH